MVNAGFPALKKRRACGFLKRKLLINCRQEDYRMKTKKIFTIGCCLMWPWFVHLPEAATVPVDIATATPSSLLVGLFENPGGTWMDSSGVHWNARYCYLTKGWANNWGWGQYDGWFALSYFKECDEINTIPCIAYYQVNGESPYPYDESKFLVKCQTDSTMKSYFSDFKLLMQRAKEFGKPVYILLEADGFGYLEQATKEDPTVRASVASTGLPELAGLPNTVAGWGMAFLAIKKAVGASNALLGIHISGWASNQDLFYYSVTIPLQPEIDKVYKFLSPLGVAPNATGSTYDVLVGDPLDRDADYYRIVKGDDGVHWWDTSTTASVNSRSFNRYCEWLRLWNATSGKHWVLWQIPLGNSNHLNIENTGKPREGYKDNRPEYFFGDGSAPHRKRFADAGVIALLFGAGASGVSSYGNDIYTDGKSFIQSRCASFFAAGGLSLKAGSVSAPRYGSRSLSDMGNSVSTSMLFDLKGRLIDGYYRSGDGSMLPGINQKDGVRPGVYVGQNGIIRINNQ
jgi:hypothetical protein